NSSIYTTNKYVFSNIKNLPPLTLIYYFIVTWGVVAWFAFKKKWDLFAVTFSANLIHFLTPQMRGWYVMFIFPIFLFLKKDSKNFRQDLLMITFAYIFTASTYP